MTSNDEQAAAGDPESCETRRIKPGDPASEAIAHALRVGFERLRAADPAAQGGEVEGVHRLRTSARRLRSELRAFRALVDPEWREALERELKWLGGALGRVRDLDILRAHLEAAAQREGEDSAARDNRDLTAALRPLFESLDARHEAASKAMRRALRSKRCRRLFESIHQSAEHPPLVVGAGAPCRAVLPPLVRKSWKRLRKEAEELDLDCADSAFHEVRKLAKRARYTAERIAPALGRRGPRRAGRYIQLTTAVQDVLGAHQDMTIAIAEVEALIPQHPDDRDFQDAAQVLLTRLRQTSDDALRAFFDLWPRLARKKPRRWFKRPG